MTGNVRMPSTYHKMNEQQLTDVLMKYVTEADNMGKVSKLNLYLAGPWFTPESSAFYDAVMAIEKNVRKNSNFKVFYPREVNCKTPEETFNNNVKNIDDADVVVAIVCEKDVGTAWEIGMAYALGKDVYLLGYDDSTFLSHTNLMLAFTGKCFTIDNWAKFLTQGLRNIEYVDIPNAWEGIE